MKKIAVLGARGFIGKNTVEYLENSNKYQVFPVTRANADLLDAISVSRFINENKIDIVIHCANQGGTRKNLNQKSDIIGNNLKMFFNVERSMTDKMIFVNFGSGAQYDKARDLVHVKEQEFGIYVPKDDYGYSKYVMSKYLNERRMSGCKIFNPILFGVYGIGEDYTYRFISNAIIKNLLHIPITIHQNVIFDYLYIKDYFKVLEYILDGECTDFEFNVTPQKSISLVQIAECINSISGYKSDIIVKNEGFNYQYTGDNERLMKNLGANFVFTSYEDGILEMYRYYKDNLEQLNLDAVRSDSLIKYCNTKENIGEDNE